jgi:transcriptional regulator with XRE-family HTH domain
MAATRINQLRLRREMACRGWNASDLAQLAGLSPATLTAALQGRSVSPRTVRKIALVIARTPAIPEAVDLLEEGAGS